MSRLNLDFSIESNTDRSSFITTYLSKEPFLSKPPTSEELEMCGNYILWGKDSSGQTPLQQKEIEIKTANLTWDRKETESIENLLSNPTYSERNLIPLGSIHPKNNYSTFQRKSALAAAPPSQKKALENLFEEIDRIDYTCARWEQQFGKRTAPIRSWLVERLGEEIRASLDQKAATLSQFQYLKLRHLLVELRREQFTIRDSFREVVREVSRTSEEEEPEERDSDWRVMPLGRKTPTNPAFRDLERGKPEEVGEEELRKISRKVEEERKWELELAQRANSNSADGKNEEEKLLSSSPKRRAIASSERMARASAPVTTSTTIAASSDSSDSSDSSLTLDFRNPDLLYKLIENINDIQDSSIIDTFLYYVKLAHLAPILQQIYNMKMLHIKNADIAAAINSKYSKSYTPNYISTLWKQKIIPQIAQAASYHLLYMQNIFFPENFKVCRGCGRTLLICSENFVRKSRASDGFSSKCKMCDRKDRKSKEAK